MIGKFILPWFGGCPAVWTTCMLFFQTVLFGGYAFAHGIARWTPSRWQTAIHLALVAAAAALLPIAPTAFWKPTGPSPPTLQILALLTVAVGLPYFALSATSPLAQVWFSRSCPGRSPYRLYAVSNFGSLAALLSYPFLVEPAMTLAGQSRLWSAGFVLYAVLCAAGVVWTWRTRGATAGLSSSAGNTVGQANRGAPQFRSVEALHAPPTLLRRALWLLLPACASLALLATTNHVCQDVAVVPFLWVAPLALYLLSFILCFDHPRWYVRSVWAMLALTLILTVSGVDFMLGRLGQSHNFVVDLFLCFAALLAICMVCHGELVLLKPEPRRLTEFYLFVAAGGALGGVLVSIVAPLIFRSFFEWQLGLFLAYFVAAAALMRPETLGAAIPARAMAGVSAVIGLVCLLSWQLDLRCPVDRVRNFYGVVSVWEYRRDEPEEHNFQLVHGNIAHGEQFVAAAKRRRPTMYYGESSGVGCAIRCLQKQRPAMRVGVVGLGVGTLAAYAREGDEYEFYEINPEVPRLAKKYFTYLADCRGKCDIVLGDARLSLERPSSRKFDLLALDAFSGDSIPTHLLTREALAVYLRRLASGGLIAVHVTNTYLSLAPVVRAAAEDAKLVAVRVYNVGNAKDLSNRSDWMLVGREAGSWTALSSPPPPPRRDDLHARLWTDQYSNLFEILGRE